MTRALAAIACIACIACIASLIAASTTAYAQQPLGGPDAGRSDEDAGVGHALLGQPLTNTGPDGPDPDELDERVDPDDIPLGPPPDDLPEALRPSVLTVQATPSTVSTGDVVTLTITVVVREGDDVAVPRQTFEPFEAIDSSSDEPPPDNGRQRFVFRIELLALEPGEHTLEPIPLRVVTRDRVLGTVRTDPVTITVQSVLGNEPDAQPKAETAPVEVYEDDYTLAWIGGSIGTLALLALLMFLFARWWMKRAKPVPPPPPPRPSWEVAMERLGSLRRDLEAAETEGRLVSWIDGLSDALREYLGDRYGFEGLESTTDEVLGRLTKAQPAGITVQQVGGILSDCDLVKFAKATPERERCVALCDATEGIVRATTARLGGVVVTDPRAKPKARTKSRAPAESRPASASKSVAESASASASASAAASASESESESESESASASAHDTLVDTPRDTDDDASAPKGGDAS